VQIKATQVPSISDDGIPSLSIVVPVKNMLGKLGHVKSWLADLESHDVEVIFINDSSSDSTELELKEIANSFSNLSVTLLSGTFGGPGPARNQGIQLAKNEWIVFWDSDDLPNASEVQKMIKSAAQVNADFAIGCWSSRQFGTHEKINIIQHSNGFFDMVHFPGLWRWAFRREGIEGKEFPNIKIGEDLGFLIKIGVKLKKTYRHPASVYTYITGQPDQLTSRDQIEINRPGMRKYIFTRDYLSFQASIYSIALKFVFVYSILRNSKKR
jgi:glycosyltransferase involved in cell wall biosynthesis